MTLTVRLPLRVEQDLAEYCVKHRMNRSRAVKQALENLLAQNAGTPSAYELGKDLFGPQTDAGPTEDVAAHSKQLLRAHFRTKQRGKRKTTMGVK